jgi:hypothetical protein
MKSHDEDEQNPSADELREAAALAAALEGDAAATGAGGGAGEPGVSDALEAAALLRNARAPLAVPAAHEAIVAAHAAPALDARRVRRSSRARIWIATSLAATAAAGWLLFATTLKSAPSRMAAAALPPAPADLLAAQAEAARGGSQTRAALAALDLKMRDYRRQYQQSLRHGGGREP